jgi:Protein of unknown function (DUF664)
MGSSAELLLDGFGRIRDNVASVLDGLTPEQATYRVEPDANSVSWLIWHLTRVQDDHVADAFGTPQVWSSGGWAKRFGVPGSMDTGWGHSRDQSSAFAKATSDAAQLGDYHEAVYAQTIKLVSEVSDADLDRVVDTRWTPHVTLGVRLVSVLDDDMQHVGAAAYLRGILDRRQ